MNKSAATKFSSDTSTNFENKFRELALEYQEYAARADIQLRPFRSEDLPLFTKLSDEAKAKVVRALGTCVKICRDTVAAGNQVGDSPALIWGALKELGLRPPSDLFGYITQNAVVEVHSSEGIQVFRNFNFYRYCSYSIEELYCGSWSYLYDRDETAATSIMDFVKGVFSGELRTTVPLSVPPHHVRERYSEGQHEVILQMQWGAPLFHDGTSAPAATIIIERIDFVSSSRVSRDEREPIYVEPREVQSGAGI